MPIHQQYIREVLARFEGSGIRRGYVPCGRDGAPLGASGVTIGTGVDLGQQTATALLNMGAPDALTRRFIPYLGLKRGAAQDAIRRQPLLLTAAEVAALDGVVISRYVRDIAARYDRDRPARPFADLPREAQAVVVSLLYQRGLNSPAKFPQTWAALLRGDWPDAAARLCNAELWDGYQARRKAEGEILQGITPEGSPRNDEKKPESQNRN